MLAEKRSLTVELPQAIHTRTTAVEFEEVSSNLQTSPGIVFRIYRLDASIVRKTIDMQLRKKTLVVLDKIWHDDYWKTVKEGCSTTSKTSIGRSSSPAAKSMHAGETGPGGLGLDGGDEDDCDTEQYTTTDEEDSVDDEEELENDDEDRSHGSVNPSETILELLFGVCISLCKERPIDSQPSSSFTVIQAPATIS
jgi:hypothetical protein